MSAKPHVNRRILVIEDEPGLRRTLSDFLVSQHYIVQTCGDGVQGQRLASTEPQSVDKVSRAGNQPEWGTDF
jgi:DNA-binding response OmpR family regulator